MDETHLTWREALRDLFSMVTLKTTSWFLLSCAGLRLGFWVQSVVDEHSLAWVLAGALMVASLPGVAIGSYMAYLILKVGVFEPLSQYAVLMVLVGLLIYGLYGLYRLARFFVQNLPWLELSLFQ